MVFSGHSITDILTFLSGAVFMLAASHRRAAPRRKAAPAKHGQLLRGPRQRSRRRHSAVTPLQVAGAFLFVLTLLRFAFEFLPANSAWKTARSAFAVAPWPAWMESLTASAASLRDQLTELTGVALDEPLFWLAIAVLGLMLMVVPRRRRRRRVSANTPAATLSATQRRVPGTELAGALRSCRGALAGVAIFSGVSNILMLNGAIFMLQVYDRILPSRSVPTLIGLSILAAALFLGQATIDLLRGRIMTRIGAELDECVSGRVFSAIARLPLLVGQQGEGLQPQRDLDSIRTFLASPGPNALFELPWLPFYIAIIWSFHPILGLTAIGGAIVLVALTITTEMLTRKPASAATSSGIRRNNLAEASRRNAEVLAAMGMRRRLHEQWQETSREHIAQQQRVSDVVGGLGSLSRALRLMLQSAMLGVGAWLVIHGEATAGVIIAGSILAGRALAPVDLAIAHWRNFISARQSWRRLSQLLSRLPDEVGPMALPTPRSSLTVDRVAVSAPGTQRLIVQGIEFNLSAGVGLGVIGASGSGKSTFVRALVGAWRPTIGRVKLDGAALDQWPQDQLGRYIGYLPQDVELFSGTVATNIARFEPVADAEAVVAAARAAGVHDLIVSLPNGYETQIGEGGTALSAGQRQRIALARALYRDPFLIVLDEPNSNLDADGERALGEAIKRIKARGGIVVIVTHRPNILAAVDLVMEMKEGQMQTLGPRDRVLSKLSPLQPANSDFLRPIAIHPKLPN
ncbi:Type I secretion system ATP-binding protein PrsD [Ensifer sesbaniae]|nr:Type I secretion system ATP-binding protein PrsD [Ensifer sesbaniae]